MFAGQIIRFILLLILSQSFTSILHGVLHILLIFSSACSNPTFCTGDLGFFPFHLNTLLLELSQLKPQRHLSVVLGISIWYLPSLDKGTWELLTEFNPALPAEHGQLLILISNETWGEMWSKLFAQGATQTNRENLLSNKKLREVLLSLPIWGFVSRVQHDTEL